MQQKWNNDKYFQQLPTFSTPIEHIGWNTRNRVVQRSQKSTEKCEIWEGSQNAKDPKAPLVPSKQKLKLLWWYITY